MRIQPEDLPLANAWIRSNSLKKIWQLCRLGCLFTDAASLFLLQPPQGVFWHTICGLQIIHAVCKAAGSKQRISRFVAALLRVFYWLRLCSV
jgi:hypothetical protein